MVNIPALVSAYFRKTDTELDAISAQAEAVINACMSSVGALSQNAAFDLDVASANIQAVETVRRARAADPNACAEDLPGPALGHATRFQQIRDPQGVMHGP